MAPPPLITTALRTPFARSYKGHLKESSSYTSFKPKLTPLIEEIYIGSVLSPLDGTKAGRMSALYSNIPISTGYSGHSGGCDVGSHPRSRGLESMTMFYGNRAVSWEMCPELLTSRVWGYAMGMTSENVASIYGVSRKKQDEIALRSHKLNEIIPVTCEYAPPTGKDRDAPSEKQITVTKDDGVRPGCIVDSQISDGAAAMLIMPRARAEAFGLIPLGRFIAAAVVGCPPDEMGIGPALAVDVWEINEAFAKKELEEGEKRGGDMGVINPNGVAIALGHPLGEAGSGDVGGVGEEKDKGAVSEGGRRSGRWGGEYCIGGRQGMAAMFVGE
ncbi:3-ketoacyl-CoA thiolase B [Tirmania nivea]|nr:3-ketoacyl-CoA thiolase B [Tirmania nivea]